jgi:hypothetical protein
MSKRDKFEAWYSERHGKVDFLLRSDGRYEDSNIASQWNAWQSRDTKEQPVPDDVARDAARYRWLRDIGDTTWEPMAKRVGCVPGLIDMAIDAAIAAAAPLPPKEQP